MYFDELNSKAIWFFNTLDAKLLLDAVLAYFDYTERGRAVSMIANSNAKVFALEDAKKAVIDELNVCTSSVCSLE